MIIGKPEMLSAYDERQRAGELAFQPGTHRLIAAYGNTVVAYEDEPRIIWDGASFRKHLVVGADGTLYLDHLAWRPDDSNSPPDLITGIGYELESARYTSSGDFVAAQIHWRAPRGRPVRGRDGEKSYEYSRPNQADGPTEYFQIVRASGEEVLRIDGSHSGLASSADHFAAFDNAGGLVVIEAATGKHNALKRDAMIGPTNGLISFAPDGRALVAVTWEGHLTMWQLPDFAQPSAMSLTTGGASVKSMAVHPRGAVFVGLSDGQMMFVDPADGQIMHQWSVPAHADLEDFNREISAAAISDDGQLLATAHGAVGSGLRIWKISGH